MSRLTEALVAKCKGLEQTILDALAVLEHPDMNPHDKVRQARDVLAEGLPSPTEEESL